MADLFEYLNWRADVPFSVAPFNDVDNLILAELSYSDFDGIVPRDGSPIPLREVRERFFQTHSREEILQNTGFTARAPLLMDGMIEGGRFGGMQLQYYVNEISEIKTAQLSAVTFLLDDGTAYVAFRGTDSTLVGWKEDFDIGILSETSGQQLAVQYLKKAAGMTDRPLRVGGHSKGGNFAVYASSFCGSEIQDRILSVYTHDGPGFREEVVKEAGYLKILPKIMRIVPDTSMIGMLLSHRAACTVVRSAANGLLQHDGFSWQVRKDGFETAELSDLGKFFDLILDSWIDGMDDKTRNSVTDTIFTMFEATGMETFHEMSQQKWKAFEAMFSSLISMSKDKQSELLRLFGTLLKSSGSAALSQLPEKLFPGHEDTEEPKADSP